MTQRLVTVLALSLSAIATPALAQLRLVPYVTGLEAPVGMVQDPVLPNVQYVIEQAGRIRVIQNGALLPTPFLDLTGPTSPVRYEEDERGLLGLAFAPDYLLSGRAYIYFNSTQGPAGDSVVARFNRSAENPLVLDPASRFDLEFAPGQRFIAQPFANHNGGKITFGPDGFLYVALGDGGSAGDPENRAQNPNTLLGKILRIDVSVDDLDQKGYRIPPDNPFVDGQPIQALGEIWAFGVRNPWRLTFDDPALGGTGAMVFADVGQGNWEEVSYEPAGQGGRNYGWALREGAHDFVKDPPAVAAFTPLTEPIYEYSVPGSQAITGGYVYRGLNLGATYRGRYFLADFIQGQVHSLALQIDSTTGEAAPVQPAQVTDHTTELGGGPAIGNISSIDVDSHGELYFVAHGGTISKLVLDADNDTLPDGWETQFGLDPASDAGVNGAGGDADGDGVTNAQELAAGTHPRNVAALSRYLAEGSSSSFMTTILDLANPGTTPASALVRLLRADGQVVTHPITIPAQQHVTVRPGELAGMQVMDFSTVVETDQEVVVERTMTWTPTGQYGSHTERASPAPGTVWYLAEGATHGGFDLFYLLQNPTDTAATVEITYLLLSGPPIVRPYTVPANSRTTIYVDQEPDLAEAEVSAIINVTNGVNIMAERAMYFSNEGVAFQGGHASAAVPAPSTRWVFAEGATGTFFDMFLLLANPGTAAAEVTVRYLLPGGAAPVVKPYTLEPQTRQTISVEIQDPALAGTSVAAIVESTQPIVAERAMYFPGSGGDWREAHNSPGATETSTLWGLAGGEEGGPGFTQTHVLIANTSAFAGSARVTLLREGAAPLTRDVELLPDSRTNVQISAFPEFAEVANSRFGVVVESLGDTPAELIVERATYSNDAAGNFWAVGSNTLATNLRAAPATPTATAASTSPGTGR